MEYVITIDSNGLERHRESTTNPIFMMKNQMLIPTFLGGLMTFSLTSQAQERPGQGERGGANPREGIREAMIKKFDKNGDGKLDEKERPSREELQEFFRTQLGSGQSRPSSGRGRPDGEGRPGEGRPSGRTGEGRPSGRTGEGRSSGRPGEGGNMRELMLKEFDKNGDGRLDENERPSREQAQEFFRRQQGNTPSGPGQSGREGTNRPGQGGGLGSRNQGGRGFGGRSGFRPPNPVMEAIDKNKDGALSADELKNAAKALAALDKNKDGKIDREEMRPQFDRSQGGQGDRPGGFRRPTQGGRGESRPGAPGAGGRDNPRGRGEGQPGAGDRETPRGRGESRPGAGGRETPRRPREGGGRGESRPGAGGRETPRRPREGGDRDTPPRKDI